MIVPALSFFSFTVVAGAAGFGSKPDVAAAAAKVVPRAPEPSKSNGKQDDQGNDTKRGDGKIVVVESSHSDGSPLASLFGKGPDRQVCWITSSQLVRVNGVYRTTTSTLKLGTTTFELVTVFGANERDLKRLLGGPATLKCTLVHAVGLYFLPFDPNGS